MIDGGLVVGIEGKDKTGKSTLALTFDPPVYHIDLDVGGFRRASHRFYPLINSGDIVSERYYLPQQAIIDKLVSKISAAGEQTTKTSARPSAKIVGMKELWYKILTDYINVLRGDSKTKDGREYNTVVFDSFAGLWELCTQSFLQEKQERQQPGDKLRESLQQIEYGEPNTRMRTIIYAAREVGKNLILTHNMKDKFEKRLDSKGNYIDVNVGKVAAGWKYLGKEVDLIISTEVKKVAVNNNGHKEMKMTPVGRITICGMALELTDMELQEPNGGVVENLIRMYRGEE